MRERVYPIAQSNGLTLRSTLCLRLYLVLYNIDQIIHIFSFLLYRILQRLQIRPDVIHFGRIMF